MQRVPAPLLKRLEILERRHGTTGEPIPVLMLPALTTVEVWGEVAEAMQVRLKQASADQTGPKYAGITMPLLYAQC